MGAENRKKVGLKAK